MYENTAGQFELVLQAGTTGVDDLIEQLGHEPNGYFWEGAAQLLVGAQAPALADRLTYDPEGGMFVAYSHDRTALEELEKLMAPVVTSEVHLRQLISSAQATDFIFDD
ncbi:Imm51 family immunity protein [Pseudofrankia sp. BMG5.37]|nr:Imm51 family immunity protein [Pseudofrankia sp. BMG5.37]MDT3438750.1 Imm51 family immunity protein [Pseudofrankia sp. BMG5.37]